MSSLQCSSSVGPIQNTDISGIGVRISFYLQALFLAFLSARSGSADEVTSALYTLVVTNIAYAVTSLLLGFQGTPEISFQDSIVVLYLLAGSWSAVFFALAPYNRFRRGDLSLKWLTLIQSYLLFAYGLAVLATAPSFGDQLDCNEFAVVVLFRPFSALHAGRIVGWIVLVLVILAYTYISYQDNRTNRKENKDAQDPAAADASANGAEPETPNALARTGTGAGTNDLARTGSEGVADATDDPPVTPTKRPRPSRKNRPASIIDQRFDVNVDGRMAITMIFIVIIWALAVMNAELLILWSHFQSSGNSWQFGQILPMFLVIIPLVSLVKVFSEYKMKRRPHGKRIHVTAPKPAFDDIPLGGINMGLPMFNTFNPMFGRPDPMGGQPSAHISNTSIHST